jgi:RimJ/RimL family protein N-acetyltransferase
MISGRKTRLRNKTLDDVHDDYAWQTDPELAWLDAAPVITIPYEEYLSAYASELHYAAPTRCSFAVETMDGEHIGNCVYYNIDDKRGQAEIGIMIGNRSYWNKGYGSDAVTTLINHIFSSTNLNRLYLKTLASNARAQKCFDKCGLVRYGRTVRDGYDFVLMDIERQEWQKQAGKIEGDLIPK